MPLPVPAVSILICTRDRAEHLRGTLRALTAITLPADLPTELIVVDNGSRDHTRRVVEEEAPLALSTRYIFEGRPGQTTARNTAMSEARGDIFLWTDDDVRPPRDWIKAMCAPLTSGGAHGVSGKIRMARELERPWMTRTHYDRLADTRFMPDHFGSMIGANMAFLREVLRKVPAFDPELGPGNYGFGDDTLFSFQMTEAGYRMVSLREVTVEHHFEPSRLLRGAWLRHGEAQGRSDAYMEHHWRHSAPPRIVLRAAFWRAALSGFRAATRPPRDPHVEGCDRREIRMVQNLAFATQFLREQHLPRKYEPRGLRKLAG